ncbi:hypothetical protein [Pseudomonas sp. OV226]|uniref:hypothetical protein n=1 Tax=Pseudomonas sp. OV226 TaxID=2135588 RepID=UPI000D7AD6B9|nr:hypothetical protein [Pseudomonas sp. OV226]PWK33663.1 hypothetical protein C7534_118101 [Pseudomonas sp. OV226]
MIGEGIQEEVLRALVEQHAVGECLVAKVDGGPDWAVDPPRRPLGAGAFTPREGAHLASLTAVGRIAPLTHCD